MYATFTHNDKQPIVATALHTVAASFTYFILSHCQCNLQLTFGMNKNFESPAHLKMKNLPVSLLSCEMFLVTDDG